ncbi:restriction endonuclease subunit S [Hymenobacter sp. UYP22]|uniref:restriction endonuclease subunit S n=1 Tax=Hymenobacter sp. UYP22 TaxID=3156348 RepID=UPI003391839D
MKNLPKGWKYVKLGDVLTIAQYGLSMSSSDQGQYPMFRMNNFREGKTVAENMVYVDLSEKEAGKFLLKPNDILFNRTNSLELVGKTGLFDLPGDYVFASYLVRFRVNEEVADPRFINYFLNDDDTKNRLKALATVGVSQCNINPTTLQKQLRLLLPPLPEQQRIANVLDACDKGINGISLLLKKKEQQFDSLLEELIGGAKRIPRFGTGTWREVALGKLFSERSERGQIQLPLLSITGKQGLIHRDELEKRDTSNSDKSKYKVIRVGDIGYNTMRLWQGVATVADKEGIISPAYTVVVPNKHIDMQFAGFLFKTKSVIHKFWRYSQGLVDDTLNCKYPSFAKVKVRIPDSVDEQRAIAGVLSSAEKEIKLLKKQHKLFQQQKKGLMQRLLTGQPFTH